jgi:L-fucose mutarotase
MLKQRLIHPEILMALAGAGHGAKVVVTDGNYPASTMLGENTHQVYLNLEPGKLTVTEVLEALLSAVPVEAAYVMTPDSGPEPPIFSEFRQRLGGVELTKLGRFDFYDAASGGDVCLQIATGEQRIYANLMLTIGVRAPE